ncbi:MAG: hypothetical protein ACQ9MH_15535 [Nitrospinales bacterium]
MTLEKYRKFAYESAQWLANRQNLDGSIDPAEDGLIDVFYKIPTALALNGFTDKAERLLEFVLNRNMTLDGDFPEPRGFGWYSTVHYPYQNGYLIMAAQRLGRFDISYPAAKFLITQQDSKHFGVYSSRVSLGERGESDTVSTSISGLSWVFTGNLEPARKAATWLEWMLDSQPDLGKGFYCTLNEQGELITSYPEDESQRRFIGTQEPDQIWYFAGLAIAFLAELYLATGTSHYLELSERYNDFLESCTEAHHGPSSGKQGWGAALLYRITKKERYLKIALDVADYVVGRRPDGQANWGSTDGNITPGDCDLTGEYSMWLIKIVQALYAAGVS